MRRIASLKSDATDSTVIMGWWFCACKGMVSVSMSSLSHEEAMRLRAGPLRTECVTLA